MKSYFITINLLVVLSFVALDLHAQNEVTITDDISSDVTWTSDNTYFLNGLIFVNAGATLTIQPGTVIKGIESANITTGDGASALIIRRGAKIMAAGTAQEPIIFTSELDDINVPDDLVDENGYPDRQLWGGLILLGQAPTNQTETLTQIEGVPEEEDATYGGNDPDDNSGVLEYVSIRHGGYSISGVAGDEINGLTLGAVGRGTTIDHIEVFGNFDDCYEWFGGTVNTKYLVGAFCGDDTFDYDQGYRANAQFWFALQPSDVAGRGGEHDGCDPQNGTCDNATFSQVIVSNATYIGSGSDATPGNDGNDPALMLRENAGSKYFNSIFTAYANRFVRINEGDSDPDAVDRFMAGDLELKNNLVWDFGAGAAWDALVATADAAAPAIVASLSADNAVEDPMLAGISRQPDTHGLDPRPNLGSPALTGADFSLNGLSKTDSDFFTQVEYRGAFGADNWALGWTALDALGYFGNKSTVATEDDRAPELPSSVTLNQNYPNPFNPATTISFSLNERAPVRLTVHDLLGREVAVLLDDVETAGEHAARFDAASLPSGVYLYRLETGGHALMNKMLLLK
jgi:hypothetical protein